MKAFDVVVARDAGQALALLATHGPRAKLLAGGTDLLVDLKSAAHAPEIVVDISRASDLGGIELTEQGLRIGALATHSAVMDSPLVREHFPALVDASHTVGAVQTRNLGTLAGNLVTCVPSMDGGPTLLALETIVTVASSAGRRQMPLSEFFIGPRKTALKPDEMLLDMVIPRKNLGKPTAFLKFGLRKGQALALVNVAASAWIDPQRQTFTEPRIALGAVAPTVIRTPKAEAWLDGRRADPEAMAEAGRIAAGEAKPISDFRASAGYRRDLIQVLTARALAQTVAQAAAQRKEKPR
jgi:CO/xanthine dehydrogenase FAD-binding subunit